MALSKPCSLAEQTSAALVREAKQSQGLEVQNVEHAEVLVSRQSGKAHS